jgi:serpin B
MGAPTSFGELMRRSPQVVLAMAVALGCAAPASPTTHPSAQPTAGQSPPTPMLTPTPTRAPTSAPTPLATPPSPAAPTDEPSSTPAAIAGIHELRSTVNRAAAESATADDIARVVAGDNHLALAMYHALPETNPQLANVGFIFSPYSISSAFSMVYAGARGQTASQMGSTLGAGAELDAWHAGRNALELGLQPPPSDGSSGNPFQLEPTNGIFGQDGFSFEQAYLDTLARYYGAALQEVDFAGDMNAAVESINAWVNDRSHGRIPEIFGRPLCTMTDCGFDTHFVLVNVIYFKASWYKPFDEGATADVAFHLLDGSTSQVPMMHGQLDGYYAEGAGWKAASLPYQFSTSMVLIVPDAGRFGEIERGLDIESVRSLTRPLFDNENSPNSPVILNLGLPQWETASDMDLVKPLERLGSTDVFDQQRADLGGIADAPDLFIYGGLQLANITVDEKGTEAAAATAFCACTTSAGPDTVVKLTVDRPFIYLIVDNKNQEILFMGRVLNPNEPS